METHEFSFSDLFEKARKQEAKYMLSRGFINEYSKEFLVGQTICYQGQENDGKHKFILENNKEIPFVLIPHFFIKIPLSMGQRLKITNLIFNKKGNLSEIVLNSI
ncbi:MAG: hypothetical protein NZM44_02870 [Candidatus Calescibacterium sp.]|nr:hypothetical protein [Candidatus Calescibacterium sp.]